MLAGLARIIAVQESERCWHVGHCQGVPTVAQIERAGDSFDESVSRRRILIIGTCALGRRSGMALTYRILQRTCAHPTTTRARNAKPWKLRRKCCCRMDSTALLHQKRYTRIRQPRHPAYATGCRLYTCCRSLVFRLFSLESIRCPDRP